MEYTNQRTHMNESMNQHVTEFISYSKHTTSVDLETWIGESELFFSFQFSGINRSIFIKFLNALLSAEVQLKTSDDVKIHKRFTLKLAQQLRYLEEMERKSSCSSIERINANYNNKNYTYSSKEELEY